MGSLRVFCSWFILHTGCLLVALFYRVSFIVLFYASFGTQILAIFPIKSEPTQLIISKPSQEHSRGSPEFPIKHTNRHRNKDYNIIYKDTAPDYF